MLRTILIASSALLLLVVFFFAFLDSEHGRDSDSRGSLNSAAETEEPRIAASRSASESTVEQGESPSTESEIGVAETKVANDEAKRELNALFANLPDSLDGLLDMIALCDRSDERLSVVRLKLEEWLEEHESDAFPIIRNRMLTDRNSLVREYCARSLLAFGFEQGSYYTEFGEDLEFTYYGTTDSRSQLAIMGNAALAPGVEQNVLAMMEDWLFTDDYRLGEPRTYDAVWRAARNLKDSEAAKLSKWKSFTGDDRDPAEVLGRTREQAVELIVEFARSKPHRAKPCLGHIVMTLQALESVSGLQVLRELAPQYSEAIDDMIVSLEADR